MLNIVLVAIRLSDSKAATYLAKITDFPYTKVVEIYPGDMEEGLIAVGLANGKIVLTSFGNPSNNKEIGEWNHFRDISKMVLIFT